MFHRGAKKLPWMRWDQQTPLLYHSYIENMNFDFGSSFLRSILLYYIYDITFRGKPNRSGPRKRSYSFSEAWLLYFEFEFVWVNCSEFFSPLKKSMEKNCIFFYKTFYLIHIKYITIFWIHAKKISRFRSVIITRYATN